MADSIVRLRVESQEYDAKLKRAADGLTRYADECRKVGGTLEVVEQDTLDYVRALGQMDATSRTATGKLAEMKKTFTELSVQYKNLTDAEKASPFGKALESSLNQLKGRIGESKQQLDDITKEINGSNGLSGALDAIAGKFGVSIDQVTKFGGVIGIATTAVQVARDAFFQSESNIDEWGRTIEGAKGAYSVFLDTLNNGNWSNFFENLSAAIRGGRDLYDVFDRLGSIKSNNAAAIAITQKTIAELRLAKQQGENVDAKLKAATERLAALQKQSVSAGITAGSQSAFQTIRNGVNSVGGVGVNDATIRYAVDRIMKLGQGEFDKYKRNYEILQKRGTRTTVTSVDDGYGGKVNKYQSSFDINLLTKEQQKQYAIAKAITEGETRIQQGIAAYAQAVSEGTAAAREEFKGNRYALQGARGGGGSTKGKGDIKEEKDDFEEIIGLIPKAEEAVKSLQQQIRLSEDVDELKFLNEELRQAQENLKELQNIGNTISPAVSDTRGLIERRRDNYVAGLAAQGEQYNDNILNSVLGIQHRYGLSDIDMSSIQDAMENGGKVSDEELREILRQLNEKLSGRGISVSADGNGNISDERSIDKLIKDINKGNDLYSKAVGGISNIVGGMQQLGVEIPEGLSQLLNALNGISTILTGISSILSFISIMTTKPALLAMGGAIRAATGVVAGRNFSGDTVPALLNSGEVVLNRAEVGTLAQSLENGNRNESVDRQPYVTGEYIFLGLNNYLRGSGKGSIVTAKQ